MATLTGNELGEHGRSAQSGASAKRVLVTGGGGYIGAVLVKRLLDQGYSVRVLDTLYWGKKPLADVLDRIELIQGDIRDVEDAWIAGVDSVVHLAGLSNDPTAEYDPQANWEMNALGTERVAAVAKRVGVRRFTFGSSCSVYDGLPNGQVYTEEAPVNPKGAYAEGKLYAEARLRELADEYFSPVILRQATVFGFSPRMRYDLVVNTFVKDAMQAGKLQIHGEGLIRRPLVDVADVAQAHIACLEAPEDVVRGETFNVVQRNYQVKELAELAASALKTESYEVDVKFVAAPPRVRDYECSNDKLTNVVGYTPQRTVPMAIAYMISWIRSNGYMAFNNPRFYNIRWMELLKEQGRVPAAPVQTVARAHA